MQEIDLLQDPAAQCAAVLQALSQTPLGIAAKVLIGLVLLIHIYIALLETVFYRSRGVKVFRLTPERADILAPAMSNQGIYNAFLASALAIGLIADGHTGQSFIFYGLGCVIIAGLWGALTVMRSILFVQALPAVVALAAFVAANMDYWSCLKPL